MDTNKMRKCSNLLPDPGGEVVRECLDEIEKLNKWIDDLQSGMYINCVYCGHQYGPQESHPQSMADVLKEHVEKCPKHPMNKVRLENERMRKALCIYARENMGSVYFESDQDVIDYFIKYADED